MESLLICVAQVTGVHGLKGELKVKSFSDHPDRFRRLPNTRLFWRGNGVTRPVTVQSVKPSGRFFLLTLQGVHSREQAEEFVLGDLLVPEDELLPLPQGSFYIYQIIGLKVYGEDGVSIGTVKDVLQLGSNDVYVVSGDKEDLLIPALKSVVRQIDLANKEMHVTLLPGMVDEP